MNERANRIGFSARRTGRGSAMLEYVIVVGTLAVGLLIFMNQAVYDHVRGFGPLGRGLVAFYERTFGGLSLPIP